MSNNGFIEPDYAHHPGVNARPSGGQLEAIVQATVGVADLYDPTLQRAFQYGLFLISRRFFWEAHEALEPVWMAACPNSRERFLVQGLIQLANACLKEDMGRTPAALRLLDMAEERLADCADSDRGNPVLGIDVAHCQFVTLAVRTSILSKGASKAYVTLDLQTDAL